MRFLTITKSYFDHIHQILFRNQFQFVISKKYILLLPSFIYKYLLMLQKKINLILISYNLCQNFIQNLTKKQLFFKYDLNQTQQIIQPLIKNNRILNMFKLTEVAVCHNSLAEKVDYSNPDSLKKIVKGNLGIFIEVSSGMLMFEMEDFRYGINPNDQILYEDHDPNFRLILCLDSDPSNCWFLKVNENMELLFLVLSERCKFIHRSAARIIIEETEAVAVEMGVKEEINVKAIQGQGKEQPEGQSTEKMLIESSKLLGKGLALAGKAISRGLEKLGGLISKKVEPSQSIAVSENSKKLINTSVSASKKVLEFTSEQFAAIFRIAKKEAIKIANQFQGSQKGKQWKNKQEYGLAKRGLVTGLHVIGNIYDGLAEGIGEATVGLAKGSKEIIGVKYGKDAGDASLGIVQGARNIAKIYKVPRTQAKKMFRVTDSEVEKDNKS